MRFLFSLIFCLLAGGLSAQPFRYTNNVASSSTLTSNVVYGQAPFLNFPYSDENFTNDGDLVMDIYEPTGDSHNRRAAIIFAHAGGFLLGNRNHDDMVALCDSFAQKGYVTVTIDYRKNFYLLNNVALHGTRAVYRGLQDGRSAVRFLRANAATYGIDPDQVYMGGSSAGSFIALQSIYLSAPDEVPAEVGEVTYTDIFFPRTSPDMGPIDSGDNLAFSGTPNGVIALWGAVALPDWVDPEDDQPVFLAHGTGDETVPFVSGPPFGAPNFPDVAGSSLIADRLAANGTANYETYFVADGEHEFYGTSNGTWINGNGPNARWDTLLGKVTPFLWEQHRPEADFSFSVNDLSVAFADQTTTSIARRWDFGDGTTSTGETPTHSYTEPGTYAVYLFVQNEILSWDTLTRAVTVDVTLPVTWLGAPTAVREGKNIRVSWSATDTEDLAHFDVEHLTARQTFRTLGEVTPGAVQQTPLFSYLHLAPAAAQHTYRIRATDLDGTVVFSPLVSLMLENETLASPNPTNGLLNLSGIPDGSTVTITDAAGKRILSTSVRAGGVDMSRLRAGTYFLRVKGEVIRVMKL